MKSAIEADLFHKGEMHIFRLVKESENEQVTYRAYLFPKNHTEPVPKPETEEMLLCCCEMIWQLAHRELDK